MLVAGANGRVGSLVVRSLLQLSPPPRVVRALVRSTEIEDWERLSYEAGAESGVGGKMRAAWVQYEVEPPAPSSEANVERLEVVVGDVREESMLASNTRPGACEQVSMLMWRERGVGG